MKEFTLLITILFNFPNGEHQEIKVERKQMNEIDCVQEVEKNNDISINFLGNTIDLFFECIPLLRKIFINMSMIIEWTKRLYKIYY